MSEPVTPRWFVLPRRGESVLCAVDGGRLVEINPVPVPPRARCAVSASGWVAWVADEGKAIGRTHVDAEPREHERFAPVSMPTDYHAECLAFAGGVLYVGGRCGKEVLGRFDFGEVSPAWVPVEVPAELRQPGKAVDDLLPDGDRLVAVDDIVYPKYLLRYDVADPCRPELRRTEKLFNHGTYESILAASLGDSCVALLSSTVGMGGSARHIALLDRGSLHEFACLSTWTRRWGDDPSGGREEHQHQWQGVAWRGDVLLIAAGPEGVGILDPGGVARPTPALATRDDYFGPPGADARAFGEWCLRATVYRPVPGGAPVVGARVLPGLPDVLAVVESPDGLDTVAVPLP
jgi:hypothetical protein